jgi:hypothetical protein
VPRLRRPRQRAQRPGLAVALLATTACASGPGLRGVTPTEGDRFFVAGYHAYWAEGAWTGYPWDALDEIYFFELEVGADGAVADPLHDAAAFSALFADPAAAARLVEELLTLLSATPELAGLHLDFEVFEPVAPLVRDGYTAFVTRLERRMAEVDPSWTLSVFALAFDDDDVFNERALAEAADFLIVQGYDFHSRAEARAGPVAALRGWERLNWRSTAIGGPSRATLPAPPRAASPWRSP